MRLLFAMDSKDYDINGTRFERPSARGIIHRHGKLAMIYSQKHAYYKLPGGGVEKDEDWVQAMIREVHEETGLRVIPATVKEYGYVHRIQKGKREDVFIQDNYYYFCDVQDEADAAELEPVEAEAGFVPVFAAAEEAIRANELLWQSLPEGEPLRVMLERENGVLRRLLQEGYIS